jgi:dihydroorotate dehydrogenase
MQFDAVSSLGPLLRLLDAEQAHNVGIWAASLGLFPRETRPDPSSLAVTVWGKTFSNPIGLSAGFDKDGVVAPELMDVGFGFVEVGSITPLPQPGNPKPRCFRLTELGAVINRYGFNSCGVDAAKKNLRAARSRMHGGVLGINLGKNKLSEDAAKDYAIGVQELGPLADYLVINISSPNTPGLRALQSRNELETLIAAVLKERNLLNTPKQVPVLVKIAPDLVEADLRDIAKVASKLGVDGLIVSNTTIERPEAVANHVHGKETGGLSGKPLFEKSTAVLHDMYKLTKGKIPLIGVGGISSGEDAYKKIRAGASLVELYTAMVYAGPSIVPRIKRELAVCLAKDGFQNVAEAVGADHR